MTTYQAPLVIHVGYPKTATTTFQKNVFPAHPEIEYVGKFIPSFRYKDNLVYSQVDALLHRSELYSPDLGSLRAYIEGIRSETQRKVVLLSSESFVHPSVIDLKTVAERTKEAFGDCKVLITIREQIGALLSFYWMHGRHGEYLSIAGRNSSEKLAFPLCFSEWINIQMRMEDKNCISTLKYGDVVACYADLFGHENVSVLVFEQLLQSCEAYCEELSNVLGIDSSTTKQLMKGKHEHRSTGRIEPWNARDLGSFSAKGKIFRSLFRRQRQADELAIASLQDYYRPSNQRLMKERNIPIDQFGYVL